MSLENLPMSKKNRTFAENLSNMQNLLAIFGVSLIGYYLVKNKQAVSENNRTLSDLQDELERVNNSGTDKDSDQDDYIEYLETRIENLEDPDKGIVSKLQFNTPQFAFCLPRLGATVKQSGFFGFGIRNTSDNQYLIKKFKAQITVENHVITEYQPGWIGNMMLAPHSYDTLTFSRMDQKFFADPVAQKAIVAQIKNYANTAKKLNGHATCNISMMVATPNGGYIVVDYNNIPCDVQYLPTSSVRGDNGDNALEKINNYSELF